MTMLGLTAEATFAASGSRGRERGKKRRLCQKKKKKVRVHVQHWAREKIETERESKKTLIQRASVCKPYTVHHTGLSGAIQNGSEPRSRSSGPQAWGPGQAHRWAPSCVPPPHPPPAPHIARPQWATAAHFTLQEDPVCQSSSNRPACEWDGSLRPTWVVAGELAHGPADGQTDRGTARHSGQESDGTS